MASRRRIHPGGQLCSFFSPCHPAKRFSAAFSFAFLSLGAASRRRGCQLWALLPAVLPFRSWPPSPACRWGRTSPSWSGLAFRWSRSGSAGSCSLISLGAERSGRESSAAPSPFGCSCLPRAVCAPGGEAGDRQGKERSSAGGDGAGCACAVLARPRWAQQGLAWTCRKKNKTKKPTNFLYSKGKKLRNAVLFVPRGSWLCLARSRARGTQPASVPRVGPRHGSRGALVLQVRAVPRSGNSPSGRLGPGMKAGGVPLPAGSRTPARGRSAPGGNAPRGAARSQGSVLELSLPQPRSVCRGADPVLMSTSAPQDGQDDRGRAAPEPLEAELGPSG